MHVCFIVYTYDKNLREGKDLLTAFYSLTGWCDALVEQGCEVTVLLRFHKNEHIQQKNTNYHFIADAYGGRLRPWQIPFGLHRLAITIDADVFHGHNMDKVLQHAYLKKSLGPSPLVIQNHGETPLNNIRIALQKFLFKNIDAFLFCAKGQENTWMQKSIIRTSSKVFFIMEASTHFVSIDKSTARQETQVVGEPVFLWVGNLNSNKDPLTILKAFRTIISDYPAARLYMIYRFDDLIEEVSNFVYQHGLADNVKLLGSKPYHELEVYYNSADYFILGSHREAGGYSAMESMACGCVPIITNIPSFNMMTDNGRIGYLWEVGKSADLERALRLALTSDRDAASKSVKDFFDAQLSYRAIGEQIKAYYKQLIK